MEGYMFYTEAAKVAKEEGFPEIASHFTAIASVEKHHHDRFQKCLEMVNAGTLWKRDEPINWVCLVCGYIYRGKTPPTKCPGCDHPTSTTCPRTSSSSNRRPLQASLHVITTPPQPFRKRGRLSLMSSMGVSVSQGSGGSGGRRRGQRREKPSRPIAATTYRLHGDGCASAINAVKSRRHRRREKNVGMDAKGRSRTSMHVAAILKCLTQPGQPTEQSDD